MPTPSEHDKALTDLLEYGQSYMDNGRHLPLDNVIQQAEPVAWMTEITAYDPPARCTHGTVKSAQNYQEGAGGPARCRIVPLYTPPAPAPVVPEGYVLVPKEPTKEILTVMRDARDGAINCWDDGIEGPASNSMLQAYKAMLSAAQEQPK